jgi:hypothetical protein
MYIGYYPICWGLTRCRLRARFGIPGSLANDVCAAAIFPCCYLAQSLNQLDMSDGISASAPRMPDVWACRWAQLLRASHARVAQLAIAAGRSMVTASYVAPEMAALDAAARAAGVTILNECGLDPGIDHMTVARLVARVRARGGAVTSFASVCGGLPAPEAAGNPLGYKWSWSPRGALAAALNGATHLEKGALVSVAPGRLLAAAAPLALRATPAFALECLPNRDSMPYADAYGCAGPALERFFRGTH